MKKQPTFDYTDNEQREDEKSLASLLDEVTFFDEDGNEVEPEFEDDPDPEGD